MLVRQFEVRQRQLVLLLTAMQIGTKDEKLRMEGVHLKPTFHLQPAFLSFVLDEVVLCLTVQLLQLRRDHLQKCNHLSVRTVQSERRPKLFVPA